MKNTIKTFIQALYRNIGKTLKLLAVWGFIVEAVVAMIVGVVLFWFGIVDPGREMIILMGVLLVVLGPVVAFLLSLIPYCFGEIVDKLCAIECNTRRDGEEEATLNIDPFQQSIFTKN